MNAKFIHKNPSTWQRITSKLFGGGLLRRTSFQQATMSCCGATGFIGRKKEVDPETLERLEAGFAKLQQASDAECHSLLKKYLTKDVFDKLKMWKTPLGASLLDVIQSGVENLDSGVGVYAPDAESYTLFADLFDPIIDDYHGGFSTTDHHPHQNFGDLSTFVNVDPDGLFVISTRIECVRCLDGYPFNPCLIESQWDIELKICSCLSHMTGDFSGIYYPLHGMTRKVQQKLIDDHFLFNEGGRFLKSANGRYSPIGRGIFHNDAKSFIVRVNDEEHLRIISMEQDGNFGAVYSRMVAGLTEMEKKIKFSRNDRFGYLTFCPTNLGTTIRASVRIKLPNLAADKALLDSIAEKYSLQVRRTSGEHTESVGGVYDISNKRRLGLTEFQAVKEMQDGIMEFIKAEKGMSSFAEER